jgi:hypothetical protein
MDDARSCARSISDLDRDRQGTAEIERTSVDQLARSSLDILHGDEVTPSMLQIKNGADVRMVQRQETRFALKTLRLASLTVNSGGKTLTTTVHRVLYRSLCKLFLDHRRQSSPGCDNPKFRADHSFVIKRSTRTDCKCSC